MKDIDREKLFIYESFHSGEISEEDKNNYLSELREIEESAKNSPLQNFEEKIMKKIYGLNGPAERDEDVMRILKKRDYSDKDTSVNFDPSDKEKRTPIKTVKNLGNSYFLYASNRDDDEKNSKEAEIDSLKYATGKGQSHQIGVMLDHNALKTAAKLNKRGSETFIMDHELGHAKDFDRLKRFLREEGAMTKVYTTEMVPKELKPEYNNWKNLEKSGKILSKAEENARQTFESKLKKIVHKSEAYKNNQEYKDAERYREFVKKSEEIANRFYKTPEALINPYLYKADELRADTLALKRNIDEHQKDPLKGHGVVSHGLNGFYVSLIEDELAKKNGMTREQWEEFKKKYPKAKKIIHDIAVMSVAKQESKNDGVKRERSAQELLKHMQKYDKRHK